MFDDLVKECKEASKWPKNLLNSSCIRSSLCDVHKRLQLHGSRVFQDSRDAQVDLMEVLTGETQYTSKTWKNQDELTVHFKQHLETKEKDPLVRYIFLNAAHSQAPLNCTLAMFTYICTYHHVLPEFVDLVYTFGPITSVYSGQSHDTEPSEKKVIPGDVSHTRFIRGDTEYDGIPELSRSNRQSRVAYKLFAMEESNFDNDWRMRQTAVYHSLDMVNGRLFWLIIKANAVVKDRVKEDDAHKRRHPNGVPTSIEEALEAAFKTHMSLFEWSCEGWRWYISKLEEQAKPNLVKVTAALIPPVDKDADPVPDLVHSLSMPPKKKTQSFPSPKSNPTRSSLRLGGRKDTAKSARAAGPSSSSPSEPKSVKFPENANKESNLTDGSKDKQAQFRQTEQRLRVLRDFSLGGPQSLTSILSKVKEAKTAMSMNIRMLEDLRAYYEDMFEFEQFSKATADACKKQYSRFQWQARSLERLLETECLRAEALAEKIRDHTNLYEMILQAESKEIDILFSMSARSSAERMEISSNTMEEVTGSMFKIARTTERDTSSMHVITLFTLLFLPGTFLGVRFIASWSKSGFASLTNRQTFFSTPIFGDPKTDDSSTGDMVLGDAVITDSQEGVTVMDGTWSFNWQLFWLFVKICVPMMVFTGLVWVGFMIHKMRKSAKKDNRVSDIERQEGQRPQK